MTTQTTKHVEEDLSTRQASVREVFRLAWPIALSMMTISLLGLTDTFFMGLLGPIEQGAVGFGAPSTFAILALFFGTLSGLTTFVSQYFGAKRYADIGKMLWYTIYIAIILGIFSAIFINPLLWKLLVAMNVNGDLLQPTFDYMQIRFWVTPYVLISYSLLSFLRGLGDMKTTAITSIITVIANVPLTYVFAFGLGPIPAYGVVGAAIGTVISQAIECAIYAVVVFGKKNNALFNTRKPAAPRLAPYKEIVRVAVPVGVCWTIENWGWMIYGLYISSLTTAEAAANAVVQCFANLAFMPGCGISIATTTIVGQYLGAKNITSAERSANIAIVMSIICMTTIGLLALLFRYPIAHLFSNDEAVIKIAANIFIFAFVYQVFDAMGVTTSGALRGAGDTRFPMLVGLIALWIVMVPGIYIQDYFWHWGVYGAWGVASLSIIISGLIYFARYKCGKWKNMVIN